MTTTSTQPTAATDAAIRSEPRPDTPPDRAGKPVVTSPATSPRRASTSGKARQSVTERLRDRRAREERLIVAAADALARRSGALTEIAAADSALETALGELEAMGFRVDEVADILDIDATDLGPTGAGRGNRKRRGGARTVPAAGGRAVPTD